MGFEKDNHIQHKTPHEYVRRFVVAYRQLYCHVKTITCSIFVKRYLLWTCGELHPGQHV